MHSFIPPDRFLAYLPWTTIAALPDKENTVILQPLGAIEQHGPHLPLIVDIALVMGVLGKAMATLDPAIPAYVLPPLSYGKSTEHDRFPGTISLSTTTLLATLMDVGDSIYRAGFRKLVFLNGHGGQPQIVQLVARDLRAKYPDFYLFPHFLWSVPHQVAEELTPQELAEGIHAGDAETSLMWALLPDTVHPEKFAPSYPPSWPQTPHLSLEGTNPVAWVTDDISQTGTIGDPTIASPDKGHRILDTLAKGWSIVIQEIHQFRFPPLG